MKFKVYITRKLPLEVIEKLSHIYDLKTWDYEDLPVPREILKEEIKEVDGLFCLLTETIDKEMLQQASKLKVISNMAVGYNNIDVEEATKRGIAVTNTPGVLTETTADLTFALLMGTARRINEAEKFLREGKWKTWSPMLLTGQDINGATLGVIGFGRIGEAVAKRAKGFNMRILYYNRNRKLEKERELEIEYRDLNELLRESDFICILTPYTPQTKNLISYEQFKMMKKDAVLINTSRGGVVNENALYSALANKQIWGAGLDVFEEEPLPVHNQLRELSNVVLTPHIGSASIKTRFKMANLAADNLIQVLSEKTNEYIVNPEYASENR